METKFNFKSQICTDRNQSERLLALGLRRETADCGIYYSELAGCDRMFAKIETEFEADEIPAWSLHRLIEMMPNKIRIYDDSVSLIVSNTKVQYYSHDVEYSDYLSCAGKWEDGNVYHNIISCIEWLIKEGYFNKEYLV